MLKIANIVREDVSTTVDEHTLPKILNDLYEQVSTCVDERCRSMLAVRECVIKLPGACIF